MKDRILKGDALKKVNWDGDVCPYLKPSTFITHIKGLASELASHNNNFNIETGFEGQGAFGNLVKE